MNTTRVTNANNPYVGTARYETPNSHDVSYVGRTGNVTAIPYDAVMVIN
jgi:hypothetical protein